MSDELIIDHSHFKEIIKECEELREKKLKDYGLTYKEYGYVGLLVKLGDKYGRVKNLYQNQIKGGKPNFESARDSLVDLVNYTVMAIMVLDDENNKR